MSAHNALSELGQAQHFGMGTSAAITAKTAGAEIQEEALFIAVTSAAAGDAIILPLPVPGRILRGFIGATGCELWASGSSVKINDVICSATNEAAIPADTQFKVECVSSTQWLLTALTKLGAVVTAIIPDAR